MGDWIKVKRAIRRSLAPLVAIVGNIQASGYFQRTAHMLDAIHRCSGAEQPRPDAPTAVINMVRTYIPFQASAELILALKLRSKGYHVTVLYDDSVLQHHDSLSLGELSPFRPWWPFRRKASLAALKSVPVINEMLVPYSDFYDSHAAREVDRLVDEGCLCPDELDLTPFLQASLVRFFRSAADDNLLQSEPAYSRARRMFLRNCHASLAVARRVHRELSPELFVTSHGIYSTWGVFLEYMISRRVRSISYNGNGFSRNSLDLAIDDIAPNKNDNGYFEYLVETTRYDKDGHQDLIDRVDHYMDTRVAGTANDIVALGMASEAGGQSVFDRIIQARDSGRRIFGLFPNVMWDNATTFEESNRIFKSPVEWLVETVKYFAESEDKLLVIRVHPAEHIWMAVRKGITDILRFCLDESILESENIIVIPPDQRLSSYSLFEHLSGGIVYNGTIGLELNYNGVPVIVGAKAAYSDRGFTYDITNRGDYFAAFDRLDEILNPQRQNRDLLKLYLGERFFLHGVPVRFISTEQPSSPNYDGNPSEMWNDENLNHIVATMVGERRFFQGYHRASAAV